tara:strand:- start:72 stop:278 length:207 start_codon:yes stop_codon:yes gene_type:complete
MAKGSQEGGNSKVISQRFKERQTKGGRVCLKCKQDISLDEYGANKSWCLPCVRVYQTALRKKKREKLW